MCVVLTAIKIASCPGTGRFHLETRFRTAAPDHWHANAPNPSKAICYQLYYILSTSIKSPKPEFELWMSLRPHTQTKLRLSAINKKNTYRESINSSALSLLLFFQPKRRAANTDTSRRYAYASGNTEGKGTVKIKRLMDTARQGDDSGRVRT
jgi:hypothetical protein